jgi:hypothetical protein
MSEMRNLELTVLELRSRVEAKAELKGAILMGLSAL